MLKIIQIVALLQGVFLIFVLLKNRSTYRKVTFWLLFGAIVSVLFYLIGDDENNLIMAGKDLFLFDSSLFITFLFLFFRYYESGKEEFALGDLLFFLPNLIYFTIESIELFSEVDSRFMEVVEFAVELTFLLYLFYIIYDVLSRRDRNWIFYFAIPIALILGLSHLNDVLLFFNISEIEVSNGQDVDAYLVLIIAFLFYFITFSLIGKTKNFLPRSISSKYQTSNLNLDLVASYKESLIKTMEMDKLYLDRKLSIRAVSEKLNIPSRYISEVLNIHMKIGFQDFVNGYRVREFEKCLRQGKYDNYTLFGIAREVGFNSKSSFNSVFKKYKGTTPADYKKSIIKEKLVRNN